MSYPDWQHDVEKFHQKFDITRPWIPQPPTIEDAVARCMLLVKKVGELIATMDAEDMVGVSENIVDLIYLAVGTARVYGLDLEPLWEEIHTTNMAKIATSSYKVAKPMGWIPPRVRELLLEQGWEPPGSEED